MLDLQERLGVFIPQVQGKYINVDYEPVNQGFGAQCWDLQAFWTAFLGLPTINTGGDGGRWPGWAGNMVDCFPQTPEIAAAYELIGPDEPGMTGDIPVWGDSYYWYPKTHVAVLIQDKGAQLLCLSQNSVPAQADNPYPKWSTGPTTIQHLPRAGLIGFIRPRAGLALQGTITEEDDMPTAKEVVDELLGREITGDDGRPVRIEWLLKSFHGIMDSQARKIAAATAELVWTVELPNVLTGGKTTPGAEVSWNSYNVKSIKDNIADADVPSGFSKDEYAAMLSESLQKAADKLTLKVITEGGGN